MDNDERWDVIDEERGLFTREYSFAKGAHARMMTARMKDGRLLAASPGRNIPDAALRALDRRGGVGALIATNAYHYLGVPTWKAAFPHAPVYAPRGAHARLRKKMPELTEILPLEDLTPLLAPEVQVRDVPGIKIGDTWLQVQTARGPVWYVSDSCFSLKDPPSRLLPRLIFRWTDSAPGFRINGLGLKFFVNDRPAYRRWVLGELARELPQVVVTAHGAIVDHAGAGADFLRMAEARL
jgi:glyoxylase-like metal-dependent hydrolase (beta-lactamase superfamily II)